MCVARCVSGLPALSAVNSKQTRERVSAFWITPRGKLQRGLPTTRESGVVDDRPQTSQAKRRESECDPTVGTTMPADANRRSVDALETPQMIDARAVDAEAVIMRLASHQHGVVTRTQLLQAG